MTVAAKVLGQVVPSAPNTDTTLYTVPAATQAVISSITVCSTNVTHDQTFQIRIRVAGAGTSDKQFICKDQVLHTSPPETITFTIGMTLGATDVITIQGSVTDIAFQVFGQEIS